MRLVTSNLLLIAIAALVVLAVTIWIHDAVTAKQSEEMSEDFQSLVGGLGFGPALDLSNGSYTYDPRLGDRAELDEPLPGAAQNGSGNPFSIFSYPRQRRSSRSAGTEE
jgi:hypothetical protein